jgi:hypothetical protein
MSYHAPTDCSIDAWKRDGFILSELWGLPKDRINLGIGYFFFNTSKLKVLGEPLWSGLSPLCPNIEPHVCSCAGIPIISKQQNYDLGKWATQEGFRGFFPWAANYDTSDRNNSLIEWLGRGIQDGLRGNASG